MLSLLAALGFRVFGRPSWGLLYGFRLGLQGLGPLVKKELA